MPATQGPSWNRVFAAIVGLGSLAIVAFITETGLGREIIRSLSTNSVSATVTGFSPIALFVVWSTILVTMLFVVDTAIGYVID